MWERPGLLHSGDRGGHKPRRVGGTWELDRQASGFSLELPEGTQPLLPLPGFGGVGPLTLHKIVSVCVCGLHICVACTSVAIGKRTSRSMAGERRLTSGVSRGK